MYLNNIQITQYINYKIDVNIKIGGVNSSEKIINHFSFLKFQFMRFMRTWNVKVFPKSVTNRFKK